MKTVNHVHHSIDGKGLMLGKPAYTDDLADPNSLTLKVLRSPHPFAKIVAIDVSEAEALAGVSCVLTYKDFKRIAITRAGQGYPEPSPHDKFVLDSMVRHIGDEVAVVAATNLRVAEHALELIKVEYEVLEPVLDFEKAQNNSSVIHPEPECHEMFPIGFDPKQNLAAAYHLEVGDVESVLKECDVVLKESFYTQAQAHVMMEPHAVNARLDYQGRLMIYTSTQTPTHVRRIVATALDYPLSKIRIIKPRVGGGFGGSRQVRVKGSNLRIRLKLELKDILNGVEKKVKVKRLVRAEGVTYTSCDTCKGQGSVTRISNTILGRMQTSAACPTCHGSGEIVDQKPKGANAQGLIYKEERVEINIPPPDL